MKDIAIGSRVRFVDGGELGTVVGIVLDDYPFVIQWDCKEGEHPNDRFKAAQLESVEETQ